MSVVRDKIALITGGASGLGLVFVKELLKNGVKGVAITDIDIAKGTEAVENIIKEYGENKAIFIKLDVVNKDEFEDAMKKTVETFGNFDILINNAGIMNDSIYEKEIDINFKGTVNGCLLALEEYLPKFKSQSSEPIIVNVSSVAGLGPHYSIPVYCATKHAIITLSKSLGMKENYNSQKVKILTICPGATDTPIFDDVGTKVFTPRHSKAFEGDYDKYWLSVMQKPEKVGLALIKIIEYGENGSIWLIENGVLTEIEVPDQNDMKIIRYL